MLHGGKCLATCYLIQNNFKKYLYQTQTISSFMPNQRPLFYLLVLLFFLAEIASLQATALKGTIFGPDGEPLPFASVYIKGTSVGTTSNVEGQYLLELSPGSYTIVFQYVGYQQHSAEIIMTDKDILLDVTLQSFDVEAAEVVVRAGEDPAYPIIRQAIKKRKYYLEQIETYSCDSYVKGTQKVKDLPEKIMGRSLGEFRQGLDSMGNGIVYLSEAVSKLYFDEKKYKEIMISSKVSGDDNGFSFNSGVAMKEFNFYENQLTLGEAKLLSPIAQTALISYKYRLANTFVDGGKIISKIEVIPKNPLGALFHGFIYIVNEDWSIHSTELKTTGQAANISMLDTVEFRQMHLPIQDSIWKLFSQEVEFNLNVIGVKIFGRFIGVFRNYEINPTLDPKFFNAEVFKVNNDANKREMQYWDSIRPVPLTAEELKEYVQKDSLQIIWKSKAYLDSLDRVNNKPGFGMLLSGYTYRKRYQRWSIRIPSPLGTVAYNTVQGFYGHLEATFNKSLDEGNTKWYDIQGQLQYGFSDKQLRGFGRFRYKFNDVNDARLEVDAGRRTQQYNPIEPIGPMINSLYSLLGRRNYIKLYERIYGEVQYSQRFLNAFYFQANVSYQRRNALINSSDYSFFQQDVRNYYSNIPFDFGNPPLADLPFFASHNHFAVDLYLRIRFAQKYVTYPNRRFHIDSKYPEIWINYRKGIPLLGGVTNYDYLSFTLQKDELPIATVGYLTFRAKYAVFLNRSRMEFPDFAHFMGNQTIYAKPDMHWRSYQLLPYYAYSTNRWFAEGHVEHNFKSFLWNKIPLLKRLGFENLAGYHFLYTPEMGDYMEFNFAISRIGWKLLRFGRLDFVGSYKIGAAPKFGMVFSLNFSL